MFVCVCLCLHWGFNILRYFIGRLTTGVFNVKCKILDKEMEIHMYMVLRQHSTVFRLNFSRISYEMGFVFHTKITVWRNLEFEKLAVFRMKR